MLHPEWNTGWIIGEWILIICIGICLLIMIGSIITYIFTTNKDDVISPFIGIGAFILALILAGGLVWNSYPFAGAYHRYVPISGTVTNSVTSRFLSDGNGSTQNFLIDINGQPYRCDDTRCSNLAKGAKVTLMCEKSFQTNAVAGYVCNWGKLGLNN